MKLTTRLVLLFFISSFLPVAIVGYLTYLNGRQAIEDNLSTHLMATTIYKQDEFLRWIDNNENKLTSLAQRPLVREYTATLLSSDPGSADYQMVYQDLLNDHLIPSLKDKNFHSISLIEINDGEIVLSTEKNMEGKFREAEPYFLKGMQGLFTDEVRYFPSEGKIAMHISIPILDGKGDLIAVLAGNTNLDVMTEIMQQGREILQNEETYIVNPAYFFVTEPWLGEATALQNAVRTEGVTACLDGQSGFKIYQDYHDVDVLGAFRWIPERNLCIVTELDQNQALEPILSLRNKVYSLGSLSAILMAVLGFFIANTITKPVGKLVEGANQIGKGNLDYQINLYRKDELGTLATSFNTMATNLGQSSKDNQQLVEKLEAWSQELETRVEERTKELKAAQIATMNIMKDIENARQQTEEANIALNVEKSFTDQIINSIPGIFYVFDQNGKFVRWNENFSSVTEYPDDEIAEMHPIQIFRGSDQEHIAARIQKTFEDGKSDAEANLTTKSGQEIPYFFTGFRTFIHDSPFLIGTGFDISDRKLMEFQIREALNFNETIISSTSIGISAYDSTGQCILANQAMANIVGATKEQVLAQNYHQIDSWEKSGLLKVALEAKKEKVKTQLDFNAQNSFGQNVWLAARMVPFVNQGSDHLLFTIEDISHRKETELALEEKATELKKSNQELERFAYVASHDLQEPLRMVTSYLQLLERRYKERLDGDALEFINYAVDGSNRMKTLINDLLAYSRVGTRGKEFIITDIETVFSHAIDNLQESIKENKAKISHDSLPKVIGDDVQLRSLFQNLIGNAIKFHGEEAPKIHIGVEQKDREWIFSVSDNGIGINPQYFERIFIIFQRLHNREEYSGTGIGLAVSKRIVERHGGRIWVESQDGAGSTFYFTLPVIGETNDTDPR